MSNYTYMVTNKINGKVYVGSHSWDGEGLDPNYYGSGTAITRAVKKYGKENFQVEVLYYYESVEECRKDEERILTEYDVKNCPHSYNIKNAAIGMTSEDMTGENNPNYGKRGKDSPLYGKHLSEDTRQKISQARKGKTFSDEHRKKISESKKGENNPNYGKRGKGTPMYGKHHTDETRNKISQANKGKNNPMYGKRGKDAPWYGKHLSDETRKKLSQSKKNLMTPVVAIDKNGKVKIFESQSECSRVLGLHQGNINSCLKGSRKSTGGYSFKYIEQLESGIYEGITEGIAE